MLYLSIILLLGVSAPALCQFGSNNSPATFSECLASMSEGFQLSDQKLQMIEEKKAEMETCILQTSRASCVGLMNPEVIMELHHDKKAAMADCLAVSSVSGGCQEEPLEREGGRGQRRGRGHRGGGGHMKMFFEILKELKSRDPQAMEEIQACMPFGGRGHGRGSRQPTQIGGHGGGHHGGKCAKKFCPCEAVKACKEQVRSDFANDIADVKQQMQQGCTCILTGNNNAPIDEMCFKEERDEFEC